MTSKSSPGTRSFNKGSWQAFEQLWDTL